MSLILFPHLGIMLETWHGIVRAVSFHIRTPSVRRHFKSFKEPLLAGVLPTDTRTVLLEKLGQPYQSNRNPGDSKEIWDYQEVFKTDKFRISFCFDGRTERLDLVSVNNLIDPQILISGLAEGDS